MPNIGSHMPNAKYPLRPSFSEASQIPNTKLKGFTLIEALAFLFLFVVVSTAFFEAYAVGTRLIIESKNRLGATALANQKMEIIRSIDYDSIGTKHWNGSAWVYGIPAGDLLEDESISVNTRLYAVHTFVQYADDVFDGTLGGAPNDAIPNDYKRIRISVAWGSGGVDQAVAVFANISPNGVESSAGGGVLSINILDSAGFGVPSASVHIVNSAASVDVTAQTDASGNITLPGTPAGTQNYVLTVSKSGYYGAVTYPPFPPSTYNPIDVHASVAEGVLNQKSMVMDQYADITVRSKDPFGTDVPDINFHMAGGKILGTDPVTLEAVYEYDQALTTNASGTKEIADQSYGQYTLSESGARYELYKLSPEGAAQDVFDAPAGQATIWDMILLDTEIGSVKGVVTNQVDGSAIAGASVHLSQATLPYDATVVTDQYGFAYFPTALPELLSGTYDITVSALGYGDYTGTATVNGALVSKAIPLTPN